MTEREKAILCYGDSNTWGYEPGTGTRYARNLRWPGVVQAILGAGVHVIEEGLNGRTTDCDDPTSLFRNGRVFLGACLESQRPLDLVILMLGTNDTKKMFGRSAPQIAQAMAGLMTIVRASGAGRSGPELSGTAPRMLLVAPPAIGKLDEYKELFEGAAPKAAKLAELFRELAVRFGCEFLDASAIVRASDADGIHLDATEHEKLGKAVARKLRSALADR